MKTQNLYKVEEKCCGCSMCANVCPTGVIKMLPDQSGFLYPKIVNETTCLNCGKCLKVCPIKNAGKTQSEFIDYYAASFKDKKETISCSSGGLATAISRAFIKLGGVVYGAAYSNDYKNVIYIRVNNIEDIEKLKGSKYAQAEKGMIYKNISDDLKLGIKCLFIGLPCDVAAVSDYFRGNKYLYTIELICHGPTSTYVQKQYCENIESKYKSSTVFFSNRYKKNGEWKPFYNFFKFENGQTFMEQFHTSSFGSAFRYLKRPSCYVCPIKENNLCGNLMIGDYHYVETGMVGYNPHGVSSAIVHDQKGKELMDIVDTSLNIARISRRNALANGAIHHPISKPQGAIQYRAIFQTSGLNKAHSLWMVTISNLERTIKASCMKLAVKIKRIVKPSSKPK